MQKEFNYLHKYRSLAAVWEVEYPSEDPLPETDTQLLITFFLLSAII